MDAQPQSKLGIARSIALGILFIVIIVFVSALQGGGSSHADEEPGWELRFIIQLLVAWSVVIGIASRWVTTSFRAACRLRNFSLRLVPSILIASFGLSITLGELSSWIPMSSDLEAWLVRRNEVADVRLLLVATVMIAPIAEEIFFRGFVLTSYLQRYSVGVSICISALLFAFFHLNPWQAVSAFPLGVAYGWLCRRTDSLYPSLISHATINLTPNFLVVPLSVWLGFDATAAENFKHFPPTILVIGLIATVTGLGCLHLALPKNDRHIEAISHSAVSR